jgi:hypothetical protein
MIEDTAKRIPEKIIPMMRFSEKAPPQYGSGFMISGIWFRIPASAKKLPKIACSDNRLSAHGRSIQRIQPTEHEIFPPKPVFDGQSVQIHLACRIKNHPSDGVPKRILVASPHQ